MDLSTVKTKDGTFGSFRNDTYEKHPEPGDENINWADSFQGIYHILGPCFFWAFVAVGIAGAVGNILNIAVYTEMKFSSTIYISYAALAVSDLMCVLFCIVSGFRYLEIPILNLDRKKIEEFIRLVGAFPNFAFSRTTGLLTAWISLERCLCVIFPTKVKIMVSRTVTKMAIFLIYILGCLPLVFLYMKYRIEMQVDPRTNITSMVILQVKDRVQEKLDDLALSLYGIIYPVISGVSVTICTIALIIKLRQITKWRNLNAAAGNQSNSTKQSTAMNISTRDIRVTRVVVTVAGLFLICSLPTAAHLCAVFTVDGYSGTGRLRYITSINNMITMFFAQINSSLNIVIFTASGQRFRTVLIQILKGQTCGRR